MRGEAFESCATRSLAAAVWSMGESGRAVLRDAQLDEERLRGAHVGLRDEEERRLWTALIERTGQADVALALGARVELLHLGLLGHLVSSAESAEAALLELCRLAELGLASSPLERIIEPSHVVVVAPRAEAALDAWEIPRIEFLCSTVIGVLRKLAAYPALTAELRVPYDKPAHGGSYLTHFGVRPQFSAPTLELRFDRRMLDVPCAHANPAVHAVLLRHAEDGLTWQRGEIDHASRVTRLLRNLPDLAMASVQYAAEQLGVAPRTLHRRLRAEQVSFRTILDEVRLERCLRLLERGNRLDKEIAHALGFANPSNFYRAFRRWTGASLSRYRAGRSSRGHDISRAHGIMQASLRTRMT